MSGENDALLRRISASFARQGLMRTLGGRIEAVTPGGCTLSAAITPEVSQQHGSAHAGLTFSLGDAAAGYAALTLLPEDTEVMTSEIKINLLRPGRGERMVARGEVLKAGRRLIVVQSQVFAVDGGAERQIAQLLGTMVPVSPDA